MGLGVNVGVGVAVEVGVGVYVSVGVGVGVAKGLPALQALNPRVRTMKSSERRCAMGFMDFSACVG
ncbi:MAG: hypothetical protein D6755_13665 [Anaerolineae bacterium]|nr:MAG: hypothetical protein D6755_13665 [Anaerolineae bacterium]